MGQDGDDVINGGAGNDLIQGGTGTDTAVLAGDIFNFQFNTLGATILLSSDTVGNEGTDTLTSIEVLRLQGVDYGVRMGGLGVDSPFNGGVGSQIIFGRTGNDVINAGGDSDIMVGGAGNDMVNGRAVTTSSCRTQRPTVVTASMVASAPTPTSCSETALRKPSVSTPGCCRWLAGITRPAG